MHSDILTALLIRQFRAKNLTGLSKLALRRLFYSPDLGHRDLFGFKMELVLVGYRFQTFDITTTNYSQTIIATLKEVITDYFGQRKHCWRNCVNRGRKSFKKFIIFFLFLNRPRIFCIYAMSAIGFGAIYPIAESKAHDVYTIHC